MTVVVWMKECAFCHTGHYTDQECELDKNE